MVPCLPLPSLTLPSTPLEIGAINQSGKMVERCGLLRRAQTSVNKDLSFKAKAKDLTSEHVQGLL